jgi:hypothetical protein
MIRSQVCKSGMQVRYARHLRGIFKQRKFYYFPVKMEAMFAITKDNKMNAKSSKKNEKRAYQLIDLWKRQELIQSVTSKEETMKDCSKRLEINYCTAKHIMKVYRKTGSSETDLMRKKKQLGVLKNNKFAVFNSDKIYQDNKQINVTNFEPSNHESTEYNLNEQSKEMKSSQFVQVNSKNSMLNPNFLFENVNLNFY